MIYALLIYAIYVIILYFYCFCSFKIQILFNFNYLGKSNSKIIIEILYKFIK